MLSHNPFQNVLKKLLSSEGRKDQECMTDKIELGTEKITLHQFSFRVNERGQFFLKNAFFLLS